MKTFINARIYDFDNYIENGYIRFAKKIVDAGPMSEYTPEASEVIDLKGDLVMPGLIVGHTHIYSAFARGFAFGARPKNFQDILEQIWWKLDRNIDNQTTYASGIVFGIDHLKNGVTTLIDHHASGLEIVGSLTQIQRAVVETIGMRGIFAFETSDRFPVDQCISENLTYTKSVKKEMAGATFGLHASMSLSEATLNKVSLALEGRPIHIHVAESLMDQEDCQNKYGMSVIERLDRHGLINTDSIIVHAVHVSDRELEIIKKRNAVIAINVSSNMNNSVGLPDIARFMDKGIPVIIGNDGLFPAIANEYVNVVHTMHHLYEDTMKFGFTQLKRIIEDTYRYASRVLKVNLGKIKPGYEADLVSLPYVPPTTMNADNVFGHLFYGLFPAFRAKTVYVAGKQIINDYRILDILEQKYQDAKAKSHELWQRINQEGRSS
ncbi:MAG: amidohydrolase family protein [Bacilli bacterium]|nr:amidohydrolase family protein [Bacilli bacterium]MBN2696831.1 amidohydrolase family protein [Bacilli bacterium]